MGCGLIKNITYGDITILEPKPTPIFLARYRNDNTQNPGVGIMSTSLQDQKSSIQERFYSFSKTKGEQLKNT